MVWLLVALTIWMLVAAGAALVMGAATRTAEAQERLRRVPALVPERWSLTPSR